MIRCTETGASDSMRSLYMLQKKTNAHMLTVPTHTAADSYWTILSASIGDSYKYIFIPPYAIGSVPSLSGHAIAYR